MKVSELKKNTEALITVLGEAIDRGESIVVTGHDSPDADSIISAYMMKLLLGKFNISVDIRFGSSPDNVTARDMSALGILDKIGFEGFDGRDALLLVDHHKSFYKNRVIASVDHHTTLPESEGDISIIVSASSCGRVIFDMAKACGAEDGELERLAIYSVYLDTQSCRSPKFKRGDVEWLERGIEKYGIDRGELERMGFCLCDPEESVEVLANYGYKKYSFGIRPSFSSCVQIDPANALWSERTEQMIAYLKTLLDERDGAVWAFVVNIPSETRSDIYFIDRSGGVDKVSLDRLASRSRDVIPIVSIAE